MTLRQHRTSPRTAVRIARSLRKDIGAHVGLIGDSTRTADEYYQARARSDQAEQLLRYLAQHLTDRHAAVLLCRAAGCPGYINFR